MNELTVKSLTCSADGRRLLNGVSYTLRSGELVALLGPNGAGKTSLIRGTLGLLPASSGQISINGKAWSNSQSSERARQIAYLPQKRPLAWPVRVRDIVALGRFSYGVAPGRLGDRDAEAVQRAMQACDVLQFEKRSMNTLSGGEQARVHCARAFAAETPLLIADEPTAELDPRHRFCIMDLLLSYVAGGGGALVVLHEVDMAARYATRLLWMQHGYIVADGPPEETLTVGRLESVYGVRAQIIGRRVEFSGAL